MISIIVAMNINGVIGKDGKLPFHNPVDMKRFKDRTLNHTVVMGHKTFNSLSKPLIGRRNIVLSRNEDLVLKDAEVMSLQRFIKTVYLFSPEEQEIFVIGGGQIYSYFLDIARKMYITMINGDFEGDTYFPNYDKSDWKEINKEVSVEGNCTFLEYDKIWK